jgi:hypothetical protein
MSEVSTGAIKYDENKLPLELLPLDALEEVAAVLHYGAKKYSARNWEKGFNYSRLYAAAMRHLWAWFRGEDKDPESGLFHLAHFACTALFLLAIWLRDKERKFDDRPKVELEVPK